MSKILVIDDEADMRFAARMLLERSGHQVIEASDGNAALAILEQETPDLALLDMRLPGMDGIQILQKIREKTQELPVVMVTGYGNVELAEQAIQLGADHYLSKPFRNKELLDVIGQVFQKRGIIPTTTVPEPQPEAAAETPIEVPSLEEAPRDSRALSAVVVAMAVAGVLALGWRFWSPKSDYTVPYSNPASIVFLDNNIWVADWLSQAIYVHDVRSRELRLKKTYYLPEVHLTGMAVLPDAVYTADAWAHVIRKHRMDDSLSVMASAPSPGPSPCSLFWDGRYLWSCDLSTGKIYQHEADDRLTVVASYSSPGKAPVGFFKDDRFGWSLDAKSRRLYERRLDQQLSILSAYSLLEWEEGSAPLACFTWHNGDLWFTRTGENKIHRRSRSQLIKTKD